jgi:MSHA biogenesis protein MshL
MQISRTPLYFGCVILLVVAGCTTIKPSEQHITRKDAGTVQGKDIPPPIRNNIPLPPPTPEAKVETYSVVVTNVPAQEILFALARDAKVNLDIYPGVQGNVTLNAINQTLPQILDRVSKQIDIRYELNGPNLSVMPDTPYLKQYKIDYVNMTRDAEGGISNSTQVGSGITGAAGGAQAGASTGNNNSQLNIKDVSKNRFWETLVQNIKDILHETDKILPAGSSETVVQQSSNVSTTGTGMQTTTRGKKSGKAPGIENSPNPANLQEGATTVTRTSTFREAASVIANPETGIITVRATGKQHEKIQQFIDQVMANARRQVMIEVTIAEVSLNKNYQQGIDWSRVLLAASTKGFTINQGLTGGPFTNPPSSSTFVLGYTNPTSKLGNLKATVSLLSSFGDVKVLSSPTLSVMNNQTAMLRVVDNLVYFTVESNSSQSQTSIVTTYTTTPHSVPVGLTMSITPQISDSDSVQIDVRPSITRILTPVQDPNPALSCNNNTLVTCTPIVSTIPQVQTREMESVLKIEDNQIAVLGGLMEDELNNQTYSVPLLGDIPLLGELFKFRNDTTTKTELVIFLRPTVIHSASINEDFSRFRNALPGPDFLKPGDTSSLAKP